MRGETETSRAYQRELSGSGSLDVPSKVFERPQLPRDYRTLTRDWGTVYCRQARNYLLKDRGLSEDDIYRYRIGYCEDGKYAYRVVFPSFDNEGGLNFVIGRTFYDHNPPYTAGNYDKESIVFNEYLINWKKPVVLVEGTFDAIRVGDNAVPLLGSSLGADTRLFQLIVQSGQPVYLMLDADAMRKQFRVARRFLDYDVAVNFVNIGIHKDPGSMDRDSILKALGEATLLQEELDLLPIKMRYGI
jgi:DNA primase